MAPIQFNINYGLEAVTRPGLSNGHCWLDMFRDKVMVTGYPIPPRPKQDTGLEILLGLMAALINGTRLVDFGGTTFLKGFSAMFATSAILDKGAIILWHYFPNPEGQYISYADQSVSSSGKFIHVPLDVVERSCRIVGWCETVKSYTGKRPGLRFRPFKDSNCTTHRKF